MCDYANECLTPAQRNPSMVYRGHVMTTGVEEFSGRYFTVRVDVQKEDRRYRLVIGAQRTPTGPKIDSVSLSGVELRIGSLTIPFFPCSDDSEAHVRAGAIVAGEVSREIAEAVAEAA